ncbi:MAG: DUF3343 domain-containing protein [Ruminococcaceae bacterium]|nr:DUF3343 domain-containing protein [Oscillospiraceae bacterium]
MHHLCTASIGSLTHAMKGQRLLSDVGIESRIVKLDAKRTRRGCAYGIEFSCAELKSAKSTLGASHLPVSEYFSGGGGELL